MNKYLADIVHPLAVGATSFKECTDRVSDKWGKAPSGIVFPLVTHKGVTFESSLAPSWSDTTPQRASLVNASRFAQDSAMDLWLAFDLSLQFLQSDLTHKKDFQGDATPSSCIVSPATQRAFALLFEEAMSQLDAEGSAKPKGIVIPIQDLWGMSAEDGVLSLTCFCAHCRGALRHKGVDLSRFRGHPSPWNLLLKDSVTGVSPIDAIGRDMSPTDIVAMSVEKQFLAFDELRAAERASTDESDKVRRATEAKARLAQLAETLKLYMDAISDVTKTALKTILSKPKDMGLMTALIVGTAPYEWSTRMYYTDYDDVDFVDEVWAEPSNNVSPFHHVGQRYYLFKRARYHVDAFYEVIDDFHSKRVKVLTGITDDRLLKLLHRRGDQAVERAFKSKLDVALLPQDGTSRGSVVPVFDDDLLDRVGVLIAGDKWYEEPAEDSSGLLGKLGDLEDLLGRVGK